MKIESINKEVQEKVMQLLNDAPAEKKAEAIMQSIEMIQEAAHEDLVNQVVAEAERASHDADFKKQLGLRNLSQEEKKFYEGFKDIKQSITANQIDIIPTEIIDRTLDDVKKASPILNLVNMAPANVKKWIVASHTGAAVWGALGLKLKVDGTVDFKKSLTEVNNAVNENRSAFKLAKSEWDKSTSSAEKLRTTQEYLQNQLQMPQSSWVSVRRQVLIQVR